MSTRIFTYATAVSRPLGTIEIDRPDRTRIRDGIKITPTMIDAGLEELFWYEPGSGDGGDIVADIFAAMTRAQK